MQPDSSRHVAHVLRDVLRYTLDYVAAVKRFDDIESFDGDGATAEFELAEAIGHLAPCIDEFEGLCRRIDRLCSVAVERSVLQIKQLILNDQVSRWGWQFLFGDDGRREARRRVERHRRDREIPFLRACLAWRLVDCKPDEEADRYADRARALRLEPLPIEPAEAESLASRLREKWRRSPVLGTIIPTPLADELAAIERALDVLKQIVPTLMTPEDAAGIIRTHKAEIQRYRAKKLRNRAVAIVLLRGSLPELDSVLSRRKFDPLDLDSLAKLDDLGFTFRLAWSNWHWAGNPEDDSPFLGATPPSEVDEALERLGWSFGTGDPPCTYNPEDIDRIEQAAAAVKSIISQMYGSDNRPLHIEPASVRNVDEGLESIESEGNPCPKSEDIVELDHAEKGAVAPDPLGNSSKSEGIATPAPPAWRMSGIRSRRPNATFSMLPSSLRQRARTIDPRQTKLQRKLG